MSNGINLLVDKRNAKLLPQARDRLRIFRFGAMGILFTIGAFSVIISILIVFSPLPKLRSEEQKARDALAVYRIDMNKLAFTNERGDIIRKLIAGRPSYDKKLNIVESKMPESVTIDGLTIDKEKYTIKFSSNNLLSLNDLLNGLTDITGTGRDFLRVYLTSLSMDKENKKFVLVVDLVTI